VNVQGRKAAAATLEAGFDAAVRGNLDRFERRALLLEGRRAAAVAVVLLPDADASPCFLLTRRAAKLRAHGGQWALPGGRLDAGETAQEAALRELGEELGVTLSGEHVAGALDDYPTRSGYVITPIVFVSPRPQILQPNPREVASAHSVPIRLLEDPEVPRVRFIPESDRPVLSLPLLGTYIHAPTAAVLYQLREVAIHGRETRVAHFEQPVFAWR
jgi:8-oxo-dGTP pyrophosphatase MutT (NUDIX family)